MDTAENKDVYRMTGSLRSVAAQVQAIIRLVELDSIAGQREQRGTERLFVPAELEKTLKDCVVKLQLIRKNLA